MNRALRQYFKELPDHLKAMNPLLLLVVYLLIGVGVAWIYGTAAQTRDVMLGYEGKWHRQLVWAGLGTGLMLGLTALDYRYLQRRAMLVYLGTLALLLTVYIPGIGVVINNARSWARVVPGFMIQPAEFAKLGALIVVAAVAGASGQRFTSIRDLVPYGVVVAFPFFIILAQPDLGSAMVIVPVCIAILIASGAHLRWFATLALVGLLLAPIAYLKGLNDYQRTRVKVFALPALEMVAEQPIATSLPGGDQLSDMVAKLRHGPEARKAGGGKKIDNWNWLQSLLAVGSGGLFGKGYMQGTQNTLGFLPRTVAPTDFIFSVIAEETGFVGSTALIMLLTCLLLLAMHIASKASDAFGRNLAVGVATLYAVHIFINIGMTIGLLPIIGIPLPFVSYGGSFMLMTMMGVGLLQSVYVRRRRY